VDVLIDRATGKSVGKVLWSPTDRQIEPFP
jgi:hypothetical protein